MPIHKSFSKHDLITIMHEFNINIDNYKIFNKNQLVILISSYINSENDLSFHTTDIYKHIQDKESLIDMLNNPNVFKPLSVKEKNCIMDFLKDVIHYCKHGFIIENTKFNSKEELYIQMRDIMKYGDIPSLRRASKMLNMDPDVQESFIPIISPYMKRLLEEKKLKKIRRINCLIVRAGGFVVKFD